MRLNGVALQVPGIEMFLIWSFFLVVSNWRIHHGDNTHILLGNIFPFTLLKGLAIFEASLAGFVRYGLASWIGVLRSSPTRSWSRCSIDAETGLDADLVPMCQKKGWLWEHYYLMNDGLRIVTDLFNFEPSSADGLVISNGMGFW